MPTKPKNISEVDDTNMINLEATAGSAINFRDSWRIFRIMSEFVDGYQFLNDLKNEVTVLGSARFKPNNKYYKIAEEVGRQLAKLKFTTITGGGPGIMEAANKGAFEAGGESAGLNIQLPFEQRINPYVKKEVAFYYFFTRKVMMTSPANAYIYFPGGFGTLDEFFEVVDYMELGQMPRSPIVLVGKEYWQPIVDFVRRKSIKEINSISESEIAPWHVVDTAEEAMEFVKDVKDRPNVCNLNNPNDVFCQGGPDWRIFRIMAELVEGFEFLSNVKNDVTVLGTKSILPGSSYYQAAYELGKTLADKKITVITGGGPGTMEAVNKGAFERGGESIGMNMVAGHSERRNNYLTKSIGFVFPFVRKLIITAPSKAFIFFPGGFGTLHQLFELLTLIETKKIEPIPLILYGKAFWQPLVDYFHLLESDFHTISTRDEHWVHLVDSVDEAMQYLK